MVASLTIFWRLGGEPRVPIRPSEARVRGNRHRHGTRRGRPVPTPADTNQEQNHQFIISLFFVLECYPVLVLNISSLFKHVHNSTLTVLFLPNFFAYMTQLKKEKHFISLNPKILSGGFCCRIV